MKPTPIDRMYAEYRRQVTEYIESGKGQYPQLATLAMSYPFFDEFRATSKTYEYEITEHGVTFMGVYIRPYPPKEGEPDFKLSLCERKR